MEKAQSMVTAPGTVCYWVDAHSDFVAVAWDGGVTVGYLDGDRVRWSYDTPPDSVIDVACDCVRYGREHDVDGAEYQGHEAHARMCEVVEGTCSSCGTYAGIHQLSVSGDCTRCFVARMGGAA